MKIPFEYINTNKKLIKLVNKLSQPEIKVIAVDFEGDFNRYRYGINLCLIQIFDGLNGYIIDPFKVNIKLMVPIFEGELKKIMFDPSADFTLLKSSHNMTLKNVIDIQQAAKVLGFEKLSLSAVLSESLGIDMPNKKKFQTANWTKRPLAQELLDYAISDVAYLFKLREMLVGELKKQGKYGFFIKMNRQSTHKEQSNDPSKRYLKVKNARRLQRDNKIYLKQFFDCREKIAEARDIPPNNVMQNDTLIKIAQSPPTTRQEWLELKGVPRHFPSYVSKFAIAKEKADRVISKYQNKLTN